MPKDTMYFPISVLLVLFLLAAMPNPQFLFQRDLRYYFYPPKAKRIYFLLVSFFCKSTRVSVVGYLYVCVFSALKEKRMYLFNPLFLASSISLDRKQPFSKWRIHIFLGSCVRISGPLRVRSMESSVLPRKSQIPPNLRCLCTLNKNLLTIL